MVNGISEVTMKFSFPSYFMKNYVVSEVKAQWWWPIWCVDAAGCRNQVRMIMNKAKFDRSSRAEIEIILAREERRKSENGVEREAWFTSGVEDWTKHYQILRFIQVIRESWQAHNPTPIIFQGKHREDGIILVLIDRRGRNSFAFMWFHALDTNTRCSMTLSSSPWRLNVSWYNNSHSTEACAVNPFSSWIGWFVKTKSSIIQGFEGQPRHAMWA